MALWTRAALKTEPRFRNNPQNRDVRDVRMALWTRAAPKTEPRFRNNPQNRDREGLSAWLC